MKRIWITIALAGLVGLSGCAIYPAAPGVIVGPAPVRVVPHYGYGWRHHHHHPYYRHHRHHW